jgi:hypothetical protein
MMTFEEFCKEFKVDEAEAHELVYHLAAVRMRATLSLLSTIKPDKTTAQIIEEHRQS